MGTWTDTGTRSRRAVQLLTEAAPTLSTDGVVLWLPTWTPRLAPLRSITCVLSAEPAQTFTGTGTFLGYIWNTKTSSWLRNPQSDLDAAPLAGLSTGALPVLAVIASNGRFLISPFGIGVSGGATVTTDYLCTTQSGEPA